MKKFNYTLFIGICLLLITSQNLFSQMTWNQACYFSGTASSYIAVPHSSSLNISEDFTLEAWVNPVNVSSPSAQIIMQKREVGNNVGYTLYLSSGRVTIRTNSSTRLVGKTAIPNNKWTHIAGSFNSTSNVFRVFVDGVQDTTSTIAGAEPIANTDSLLIGKGSNSPFNGLMDEIRIWNIAYTTTIIQQGKRLTLGTNSGRYTNLVMSMTLQRTNLLSTLFTLNDASGNNNNGRNRGVVAGDMSDEPNILISVNESLSLNGSTDFAAAPDHAFVSPTSGVTIEAWVYPKSFDANTNIFSTIVHKGSSTGNITDYRLSLNLKKVNLIINETSVFSLSTSGEFFPLNKWTHVALTYSGANGFIQLILNGEIRWDDTTFVGNIHDNTDSLYIGGTPSLDKFHGLLDEIRITHSALTYGAVANQTFTSVNETNDQPSISAVYNFDGNLNSSTFTNPKLLFRNDAGFSLNSYFNNTPVSPLSTTLSSNFVKGYYMSNPNLRIPASGTTGNMISDTIDVQLSETINDVNVFVALNHTDEDNLVLSLISPSGLSHTLYSTSSLVNPSDNIITIFNDQANTGISSNLYVMFTPMIKPVNNLNSAFSGVNTSGKWKLRIQDVAASDTGILIGWGIQFNNQLTRKSVLSLSAYVEGLYNPASNLMTPDTMRVFIRSHFSPYDILDSSKAVLNNSGNANFVLTKVPDGVPVFIQLKHRNSIETWSKKPVSGSTFSLLFSIHFPPLTSHLNYDFTSSPGNAFGNNMIQVDTGPNKFAVYSGDVNQDGTVDISDVGLIVNDAAIFATGYLPTDINGDGLTDVADAVYADNNSFNFISKITP
ncbi:MAG: proprotein convertase P-domain-containing protein [Ignavibacteria bacterium]|nr:proprotein convertase P-domain-containing protein [Ignavibacteria bacterium]